jgi:hypothetical protein
MMIDAAEPEGRREVLAVNMSQSIAVFEAIVNSPVGKVALAVGKPVENRSNPTDTGNICGQWPRTYWPSPNKRRSGGHKDPHSITFVIDFLV